MISITGYYPSSRRSKYNAVLDVQVTTDLAAEPVLLPEMKRHLNMVFDTTGSYEFDDDDTKLTELIKECRMTLEKYTGCSFGAKTLQAIIRNELGNQEIPYGPINTVSAVVTEDGEAISDVKVRGLQFKWIESPLTCYMHLTYTAGYATLPDDLRRAIKEEVAFRYRNQGDQHDGVSENAKRQIADLHKRNTWLL